MITSIIWIILNFSMSIVVYSMGYEYFNSYAKDNDMEYATFITLLLLTLMGNIISCILVYFIL